jgi:hypothetical protein
MVRNYWLKMEVWDNGTLLDETGGPITEQQYMKTLIPLFEKVRQAKEKEKQ